MIHVPTGKCGFNPEKQLQTRIVKDHTQFFHNLLGTYNRCSNVYIAVFITTYARVKLYIGTYSVIYVSLSCEPLIPIDHTNTLGL